MAGLVACPLSQAAGVVVRRSHCAEGYDLVFDGRTQCRYSAESGSDALLQNDHVACTNQSEYLHFCLPPM